MHCVRCHLQFTAYFRNRESFNIDSIQLFVAFSTIKLLPFSSGIWSRIANSSLCLHFWVAFGTIFNFDHTVVCASSVAFVVVSQQCTCARVACSRFIPQTISFQCHSNSWSSTCICKRISPIVLSATSTAPIQFTRSSSLLYVPYYCCCSCCDPFKRKMLCIACKFNDLFAFHFCRYQSSEKKDGAKTWIEM